MSDRKEIRVSYSVLSSVDQCSMKFYMNRVLGLPEKVWGRTVTGSLTHVILECLARKKHRHHYDTITEGGYVNTASSPAITRLIRRWQIKHKIEQKLLDEMDAMLKVALLDIDFFMTGAVKVYEPEYEFVVEIDGARRKGVMDRLADMGNYMLVRDYKTSRERYTKQEVDEGYQTLMYSWYCWYEFNKPAIIEYVFLRHPSTKRTPNKHVMVAQPVSREVAKGFEAYCTYIYPILNNFGPEEAKKSLCRDSGFCERVCSFYTAKEYVSIKKRGTNELVGNYLPEFAPPVKNDEWVEELSHRGCPRWNPA